MGVVRDSFKTITETICRNYEMAKHQEEELAKLTSEVRQNKYATDGAVKSNQLLLNTTSNEMRAQINTIKADQEHYNKMAVSREDQLEREIAKVSNSTERKITFVGVALVLLYVLTLTTMCHVLVTVRGLKVEVENTKVLK
jgi:hypothetical protein